MTSHKPSRTMCASKKCRSAPRAQCRERPCVVVEPAFEGCLNCGHESPKLLSRYLTARRQWVHHSSLTRRGPSESSSARGVADGALLASSCSYCLGHLEEGCQLSVAVDGPAAQRPWSWIRGMIVSSLAKRRCREKEIRRVSTVSEQAEASACPPRSTGREAQCGPYTSTRRS